MFNKIIGIVLFALLTSLISQGQAKTKLQRDSATFARLILNTKEFKQEKHKMDSVFKATNKVAIAAFEIQMDGNEDTPAKRAKEDKDDEDDKPAKKSASSQKDNAASTATQDPEDNFMTATIIEQQGAANVITHEVKYDRKKHQIISIKPVSEGLDISIDSE